MRAVADDEAYSFRLVNGVWAISRTLTSRLDSSVALEFLEESFACVSAAIRTLQSNLHRPEFLFEEIGLTFVPVLAFKLVLER